MRRMILLALCGLFLSMVERANGQQTEKCATFHILQQNLDQYPELRANYEHQRQHRLNQAAALLESEDASPLYKTTQTVTIPVVFHVVVTQAQLNQLGGTNGVRNRMMKQIEVLNQDFAGLNPDSVNIPGPFKPLFAKGSIRFAPAHRTPTNAATEGFEIRITTINGFPAGVGLGGSENIKLYNAGGLDTWDPDKYLNIWVGGLSNPGILGFAVPPSFVGGGIPKEAIGVVLRYSVFGKRQSVTQYFWPANNDEGRTATHEVGHFFELEHTFGQNSSCPGAGDIDDGIADTPPQAAETFSSNNNCPPFPKTDVCTPTGNGIMWMNFMDYVEDGCMNMFTKGQEALMKVQVSPGGLSHSLTQHPEVLEWPTNVAAIEKNAGITIYPNPATGRIQISFADAKDLESISVNNIVGQTVRQLVVTDPAINNYNIDLTGQSAGVYLVHCTFASGTVTKKIVLR